MANKNTVADLCRTGGKIVGRQQKSLRVVYNTKRKSSVSSL